jgi:nitrogen fixation/metabolism regulation signal transduction histidine kinase
MLKKLKNYKTVIGLSIISIFCAFLPFLAFINPKLLSFSDDNLQILLFIDVALLILFFFIIFKKSSNIYFEHKNKKLGSGTSLKYISFFTLLLLYHLLLSRCFHYLFFNYGYKIFLIPK